MWITKVSQPLLFSAISAFALLSGSPSHGQSPTPTSSPGPGGGNIVGCIPTVPQTQGPYYLDLNLDRSDITDEKPGVPMDLQIEVVSADGCTPISNAIVEVWHADASGAYSGFGSVPNEPPGPPPGGTPPASNPPIDDQIFLRGGQVTDNQGRVEFQTIYPGWYPGRTVHIHFKVHSPDNQFTSQLFFSDALSDEVYQLPPYNTRMGTRTLNASDMVLNMNPDPNLTLFPQATLVEGRVNARIRVVVSP